MTADRADGTGLALFDLDNTLFDRARAFRAWAGSFVEERELDDGALAYLLELDRDGHAPRREVFGPLCKRYGLEPWEAIEREYRVTYPDFFQPDPAVQDGLGRLRGAGWMVVIVTNGPPNQIDKIERCGLDAAVDGWCISDVVGSAKPDAGIFHAAAALVGRPLAGWMVGDTLSADVDGGAAVGLRTIWLARGRAVPDGISVRPDVVVDDVHAAISAVLETQPVR